MRGVPGQVAVVQAGNVVLRYVVTFDMGSDYVLHPKAAASMEHAARRWGAEFVRIRQPLAALPSNKVWWQKMLLPQEFPGFDGICVLDGDLLIREDAPSPFDLVPEGSVGLVSDAIQWNGVDHRPTVSPRVVWWAKQANLANPDGYADAPCCNGGVQLLRRGCEPLYEAAYELAASAGFQDWVTQDGKRWWNGADQPVYTIASVQSGVPLTWLPQTWNVCHMDSAFSDHRKTSGLIDHYILHFAGGNWAYKKQMLDGFEWRITAG